jgi:hypothetical protein
MSTTRLLLALALALALFTGRAHAMEFRGVADPVVCGGARCILARGFIEADDPKAFAAAVHAGGMGPGDLVVLDSEGGDVIASLKLGNIVRRAGLRTTVQAWDDAAGRPKRGGLCTSACAYVFLGGVERTVGAGARIGVHQIASTGGAWALSAQDGMQIMSLVATHVKHLCGQLDLLIPTLRTPPGSVYWLSATELTRYGVVTTSAAG